LGKQKSIIQKYNARLNGPRNIMKDKRQNQRKQKETPTEIIKKVLNITRKKEKLQAL